ncbi:MAG: TipAS antibiotic-recognition domain-containing protein [Bryobacteraceae bacterium]
MSREWKELIGEVEAALGKDPTGAKGQALAGRWIGLIEEFTGGDPDIANSLKNLYADRAHWPSDFQQQAQPFRVSPAAWACIGRAIAERFRTPAPAPRGWPTGRR